MKSMHSLLVFTMSGTVCCVSAHGFIKEANRRAPAFAVGRKHQEWRSPESAFERLNVATHHFDIAQTLAPAQPSRPSIQQKVKVGYNAIKQLVADEQHNIGKVAGMTNVLSSFALIGTGLISGFSNIPNVLGPLNHLWVASTITMSVVSLKSAVKKRAKQPAVRNWIMGFSVMAICLSTMTEWVSPFAPAIVRNPVVSRTAFARLSGMVSFFNLKNLHGANTLMENRKDDGWKASRFVDYVTYVAPNLIGLVWSGYIAWFIGLRHSKHSYMNFLAKTARGGPATQALAYYTCVVSTVCALYTPSIANLRDRKILSKKGEVVGNLSLATIAWAINGVALTRGLLPFPGLPKFLFR